MGQDFSVSTRGGSEAASGTGRKIGVVVARWNEVITTRLLSGVTSHFDSAGVDPSDTDVVWVPGAFELPLASKVMAGTGRYDAILALGCVIRGDTAHFEYVAGPAADGILRSQLETEIPIIFGVLTVESRRQALVRSVVDNDVLGDNKGAEAAATALEMISVLEALRAG
ncbi:MAG: 6,7-dimethyl-8-ribityllumazine synthase [Microthrixaceae bacterium]